MQGSPLRHPVHLRHLQVSEILSWLIVAHDMGYQFIIWIVAGSTMASYAEPIFVRYLHHFAAMFGKVCTCNCLNLSFWIAGSEDEKKKDATEDLPHPSTVRLFCSAGLSMFQPLKESPKKAKKSHDTEAFAWNCERWIIYR